MTIKLPLSIKILDPRLLDWGIPGLATPGASACDLRACALYDTLPDGGVDLKSRREMTESIVLRQDCQQYIGCGFAMAAHDAGYVALLHARSGLGSRGLVLGNLTGVIDIGDYRGEMIAAVWNRTPGVDETTSTMVPSQQFTIEPGDRICQMILVAAPTPDWTVVDELPPSLRGNGGFGSTGRA